MASIFSLRLLSVVATILVVGSFAHADDCEITKEDGDFIIMKGTGDSKKFPTLKSVFEAMQSNYFLLDDLRYNENAPNDSVALYLKADRGEEVRVSFDSIPTPTKGDPKCKNKKITGYECRIQDFKTKHAPRTLPNGLSTEVVIKVPEEQTDLFDRITNALSCDSTIFLNGAPVTPAKKKSAPIQLLPSGGPTQR